MNCLVNKTYFGSLKLSHCNLSQFKLLHCNFVAVFFLYFYWSKYEIYKPLRRGLLNFWIIINFRILRKPNFVFVCEKLLIENHGERQRKNLAK